MKKLDISQEQINAEFEALSPKDKRVRIAKDVLAQLDAPVPKLVVSSCSYCEIETTNGEEIDISCYKDLQSLISDTNVECLVCAKGAIFASKVLNYDNYDILFSEYGDDDIISALYGIFEKDQLDLIECAFEREDIYCYRQEDSIQDPYIKASAMYQAHEPETRLRYIMKNIIRNDGEFKLPKKLETLNAQWARRKFGLV